MMATSPGGENEKPVWKINGPAWGVSEDGERVEVRMPVNMDFPPAKDVDLDAVIRMDDFSFTMIFEDDGSLLRMLLGKAQQQWDFVRRLANRMFGVN